MNTEDLLRVLRGKLGNLVSFQGVLASDQVRNYIIPEFRENKIAFIANIIESTDSRLGHWVIFIIAKSPCNIIYFLDSYGLNPHHYSDNFKYFLNKYSKYTVRKLNKRLQDSDSIVCGLYCAYFIYHISRKSIDFLFHLLKKDFSVNNYKKNDAYIFSFYSKFLNRRSCQYWKRIDDSNMTFRQCTSL